MADDRAYLRWRQEKLAGYPTSVDELIVEVGRLDALTTAERGALQRRCAKANVALYRSAPSDKAAIRRFGAQLGLQRLDGNLCADGDSITSLRVVGDGRHSTYIPYSNRPLQWHTDGYYNAPPQRIGAWLLHCVRPAAVGGENGLLDHEIAYIVLRDANPAFIAALMEPDVMTIPPNREEGEELRPVQSGPVFALDSSTGKLHMRYTARKRNIQWKEDGITREALLFLARFLASDSPYIFHYRLGPGEGVVSNNVLHNRSAFEDDAQSGGRLLYRARYYDPLAFEDSTGGAASP